MFTGIVAELGVVEARDASSLFVRTEVEARPGDSIAINGCCLTVTRPVAGGYAFDVMPISFARTNLGDLESGGRVNIEPAVAAGQRMGGHWLQGHVDGVGEVRSLREEGNARIVEIAAPAEILRYCVDRGSIGVDGISLTVMELLDDAFVLHLIPETRERTTLGVAGVGTRVNLEADILARYVERLLAGTLGALTG